MSLRIAAYTPHVRNALRNDPMMAMAVEQMARTAPYDGSLALDGKSERGPWLAIIRIDDSNFDGYRGTGRRVTDAIEFAMSRVPEAAA